MREERQEAETTQASRQRFDFADTRGQEPDDLALSVW